MTEPFTPGCCLPFWRGTQRSLPSCCMVKARQARLRREFSRRLPPFASAGNYSFIAPRGSRHRCCWSRMPVVVEVEPGEQRSPDSAHHLERVAGWNATVATSVADLPLVQERDETPMSNRESRWGGVRRWLVLSAVVIVAVLAIASRASRLSIKPSWLRSRRGTTGAATCPDDGEAWPAQFLASARTARSDDESPASQNSRPRLLQARHKPTVAGHARRDGPLEPTLPASAARTPRHEPPGRPRGARAWCIVVDM